MARENPYCRLHPKLGLVVLVGLALSLLAGHVPAAVPAVSAGEDFSIVLKSDGSLWGWGGNLNNQLNDGTGTTSPTPVRLLDTVASDRVASGRGHSLALGNVGVVQAWGTNFAGELGGGHSYTPPNGQFRLVQVAGVTDIRSVAAGGYFSLALDTRGRVHAWGRNTYGQLGDATTSDRLQPVIVGGLAGVSAIAAGYYHALAIGENGTVWAWGRNNFGQLGDGTTIGRPVPVRVGDLSGVLAVSAGEWFSLALKSDGTVWAWGANGSGELGDGTAVQRLAPVRVGSLADIVSVSAGRAHGLALDGQARVWAWGLNVSGQVGDGTETTRRTPVRVGTVPGALSVAAGSDHSLAIDTSGRLWQWGKVWTASHVSTNRPIPELVTGPDSGNTLNVFAPAPPLLAEPPVGAWPRDVPVDVYPFNQLAIDVVADSTGGTFVGFYDGATAAVWVQHLDHRGMSTWASALNVGPTVALNPRFAADGAGGLLVAWQDGRNGAFCTPGFQGDCDVYAQRLGVDGKPRWKNGGVPVVTAAGNQSDIALVADGTGGAILVWEDPRPPQCCRLFAQRIDAYGAPAWILDGVAVSPPVSVVIGPMGSVPELVGDGSGGAIVAWINEQVDPVTESSQLTLQRIGADGGLVWGSPGVEVGAPSHFAFYKMAPDGMGGAVLAYFRPAGIPGVPAFDIVGQRVLADGRVAWGAAGIVASAAAGVAINPQVASDDTGGVIIAWQQEPDTDDADCFGVHGGCDIFAQRISGDGATRWQGGGVAVSTAAHSQHSPFLVADGEGGAVIAWQDCRRYPARDTCMSSMDVYAQRIGAGGGVYWAADGAPLAKALGNQGRHTGTPLLSVLRGAADRAGGIVFAWPDGRLFFCDPSFPGSDCDVFAQRVLLGVDTDGDGITDAFDDSDNDGVADASDNCPLVSNADQRNYDRDARGDACDSDDDNDGTPDADDAFPLNRDESLDSDADGMGDNFEREFGFAVDDPGDAALDPDGDGLSNLAEFNQRRNPLVNEGAILPAISVILIE
jgi:alpha-tubulin suppressor-like RCC1 family protein